MEDLMTTKLTLVGIACAGLLAACNQAEEANPVDAAQDAAAGPVGQVSAATMGSNMVRAYVPNAAMGDMYEIMAADIALERSQNAEVRELAQMIKADHTAASERFKPLAASEAAEVTLPTELDERRQGLIDNLRSAPAQGFDQTFLAQQVAAHQEAVTLHRGFSDNTEAPQLAEHARTVLPRIEAHLQMAERLAGE
jgi:putative membrane protein